MQKFFSPKQTLALCAAFAMLAFAVMLLPVSHAEAQAPTGNGKIEGLITNSSKDAKPASAANLDIVLVTVPASATSMITTTSKSDGNGKFSFSNLDTVSTTRYFVTTNYGSVDYFSDLLTFSSPQSTTVQANFSIYESTEDPSVLKVTQTHIVLDVQTPWLAVQEILALENTSDRVYVGKAVGPHRFTVSVPLLPKAIDVQFDDPNVQDSILVGDGVLTYTLPIGPGQDQIVFQYAVPYIPPNYDFVMNLPFALDKFGLYMPDMGATITSKQLTAAPNPMGNTAGAPKFLAMAGSGFSAGTSIKATINNLPSVPVSGTAPSGSGSTTTVPIAAGDNSQTIGLIVLGIAGVAAIGLLAYPVLRRRSERAALVEKQAGAPANNERMDLLQQIADLDDDHETGKVTDAEYQEKRAALKAKLVELGK